MKTYFRNSKFTQLVTFSLLLALSSAAFGQSFDGVQWSEDTSNTPVQDRRGSGSTPSASGATNNSEPYKFKISTRSTNGTQRQEFKYERRSGYNWMSGKFKLSPSYSNFDKISVAQTHDDKTGSEGVFSIYQVRKSGGSYVFGVQGDTREASNSYSNFSTVRISLGQEYSLSIKTNTRGLSSYETASLYDSSGRKIWQETIVGGGDSEQYKKVGVYKLTGGKGPVEVTWRNLKFYTGTK